MIGTLAPRPRLILADDHEQLLQGLRTMLLPRYRIAGTARDGEELLALLRVVTADCLLLDLHMPGRSGLELLPDIRAAAPAMPVLIVTMHADPLVAEAAVRAGAKGFLPKDSGAEEIGQAIDAVLAGVTWISPRVPAPAETSDALSVITGLTPRQVEIARLMLAGRTPAQIGTELGLSELTVGFHRARIEKALGAAV